MESKTNYTLVGLSVITLAVVLLATCLWLSNGFRSIQYKTYLVFMSEAVSGLTTGSPVKFNGVKIGLIQDIALNPNNPQQVKLTLNIDQDTLITTTTRATLIAQGITGTTYLGLSAESPTREPLQKTAGEPYPVIPYQPSFFNQLENNINSVGHSIKLVFDKDNARILKASLKNLQKITDVFVRNNDAINQTLHELPDLIAKMKLSVNNFDTMAQSLASSGKQISDTMQVGRISINKISEQTIPPAVLLLYRLDSIANNLEIVSAQMRQNPSVILRGTTPPKPGPGESH